MSNNKGKTNDKKTYIIFAVVMVICMAAGFASVTVLSYVRFLFEDVDTAVILNTLCGVSPFVFAAVELILCVVSVIVFSKAKRAADTWDGEDEDVIDNVESRLDIPLLLSNIGMVFSMLMLAVCAYFDKRSGTEAAWPFLVTIITFILSFVYVLAIQAKVVNLEKKLNPEKRGNVFEFNFSKQWEGSMDEAERQMMCLAAYKAFRAGNMTCTILWLVSVIGVMIFNMGISAVVMVCIIWLVLSVSYIVECMKLEKKNKKG